MPNRSSRLVPALLDWAVRALALFAGLNLVLGVLMPGFDANWMWVGGASHPLLMDVALTGFSASVLIGRRLFPRLGSRVAAAFALFLAAVCVADTIGYYRLVFSGSIRTAFPVPLSALLAALLGAWACSGITSRRRQRHAAGRTLWQKLADGGAVMLALFAFGLALLSSVGATDYRRPADAVVVFGAAVRHDGSPSGALRDRTTSAVELYLAGLAHKLVLSGGRDPLAPLSEPQCMARIALELGVPPEALILDEAGANTRHSLETVATLVEERGWKSVLMVSHDYHLARIQLQAHRRGLRAFTVPATETVAWPTKPLFVMREVVALAWYLTKPS